MPDVMMPLLQLLPIESGDDLKIFAINGRQGEGTPHLSCDHDSYLSVQQGMLRLQDADGDRLLQPHESALLPAGQPFQLIALTDTRARLVLPYAAAWILDPGESQFRAS